MSEQINPAPAEERETPASGLLLGVEPLIGGASYKASATDDTDSSDTSDSGIGDTDGTDTSDSDGTDAGGGDTDSTDASDADGTDAGDSEESESGLGGENPLGLNRNRERVKNGDDKDTRDT